MAVPFATWAFGGLGALALVRGLWNPHRALTKSANLEACPGRGPGGVCYDTLALAAQPDEPVYSVGSGEVMAVGDRWLHIQLSNEPVILHYYGVTPDVRLGQQVGRGKKIGVTRADGPLEFGVVEVVREADGGAALASVEPRSWLAARGESLTVKKMANPNVWCGPGRHVSVPADVHMGCHLRNPAQTKFALFAVSVTQE